MATRNEAIAAMSFLAHFMGHSQQLAFSSAFSGEERQWFYDKACELRQMIESMPEPYGQDGKGDDAIVYLHYFYGGFEWFITERDIIGEPQHQAFGLACMQEQELGYINIAELIQSRVELDLYWDQKPLREARPKRAA